jgi:hypothetical protein
MRTTGLHTLKLLLKFKTMTLLLPFLLLITTPSPEYDPADYCNELSVVLADAVKEKVITYKEAGAIIDRCNTSAL